MARLTYATLALALASLVSGFFIRTTAVPLFASIGLSALVLLLILRGWARRVRQEPSAVSDEAEQLEELEDVDLDDIAIVDAADVSDELPVVPARATRQRPPREPARSRAPRERPPRGDRPAAARGGRVVVLPGRTRYHIPGCRFAHGKGAEEITESTARRRRYQPCSVCLGA